MPSGWAFQTRRGGLRESFVAKLVKSFGVGRQPKVLTTFATPLNHQAKNRDLTLTLATCGCVLVDVNLSIFIGIHLRKITRVFIWRKESIAIFVA